MRSVVLEFGLTRVNCSDTRLNISWIEVELPMKVVDILSPFGGISHTDDLMLLGIHSTKYEEFLFCTLSICSSTWRTENKGRREEEVSRCARRAVCNGMRCGCTPAPSLRAC